jgi:hypothetical protein
MSARRSHSPIPPFPHSGYTPLTWIELDRAAIAHNLRQIRKLIGNRPLMAVVKGNAYGHGATTLCPELQRMGVDWFGVARTREALELRSAGIHWTNLDEDISVENVLLGQPSGESQKSFKQWLEPRPSATVGTSCSLRVFCASAVFFVLASL